MIGNFVPKPIGFLNCCENGSFPFIEETFDSLTTYKKLCQLAGIVLYIENYLKDLNFDTFTDYVDEQIKQLQSYIDNKDDAIYQYIDTNDNELKVLITKNLTNAKLYTDQEIAKINSTLIEYIDNKITNIKEYLDNQDSLLKIYIDSEIQKIQEEIDDIAKNGIKVYNPVTGKYDYLQSTVDDLYGYLRYYGLTALEYDSLGLTAEEYDNKNLTARTYDLYARYYLGHDPRFYMISPFTGEYTLITNVITQLANLHKQNPITATEYDSLNLTSQNYDDKDITAYNYDFTGKSILIP